MAKFRNLKKEIRKIKRAKAISKVMAVILKEGEEAPQFNGLLITLKPAKKREQQPSREGVSIVAQATPKAETHAEESRAVLSEKEQPKPRIDREQAKAKPRPQVWIPFATWYGDQMGGGFIPEGLIRSKK